MSRPAERSERTISSWYASRSRSTSPATSRRSKPRAPPM
jgi:hypothetical protein